MTQANFTAEQIAHLVFPVVMLDAEVHTDEHPHCDDPGCPCHEEEPEQLPISLAPSEQEMDAMYQAWLASGGAL